MNNKNSLDYGKIDFIRWKNTNVMISIVTFIAAILIIALKGFNYGIDFAGGVEVQVKFKDNPGVEKLREVIGKGQIQSFGEKDEFLIRFDNEHGASEKEVNAATSARIKSVTEQITTTMASHGPEIRRVDAVGPQVGSQLKRNSILAAFYCLMVILIYVGFRFDYKYAPGAVLCLFHDAIIILGILCLFGKEINIQILAAILTLIGYSMNDTIVIYDRIREVEDANKSVDIRRVINHSINATLGRTILTSVTTLISCTALYVFASGEIKEFAFTMGLGVIIGTYSSIYVASPLMIYLDERKAMLRARAA